MKLDASCKTLMTVLLLGLTACSEDPADDTGTGVTEGVGMPTGMGSAQGPAAPVGTTPAGTSAPPAASTTPPATAFDICTNPEVDETGKLLLATNEIHNYAFSSTLSFEPTLVAPNANLEFDWSALTTDFLGHELNLQEDIDMVALMMWRLDVDGLQAGLNDDDLASSDLVTPAAYYTEDLRQARPEEMGLSAQLWLDGEQAVDEVTGEPLVDETTGEPVWRSELTIFTNPVDSARIRDYFDPEVFAPEETTYTLLATTGEVLGEGVRMIHAFKLDPTSDNLRVEMTNDSTRLDYTVDLQSLTPTQLPLATPGIVVSWKDMTTNALGNEFTPTSILEVRVSRYTQTPAELEQQFLDLEQIAADSYSAEIRAGTSVDLSTLTNEAGQSFAGIDANGTWILALVCGGCRNPAPWYMSTLVPCAG